MEWDSRLEWNAHRVLAMVIPAISTTSWWQWNEILAAALWSSIQCQLQCSCFPSEGRPGGYRAVPRWVIRTYKHGSIIIVCSLNSPDWIVFVNNYILLHTKDNNPIRIADKNSQILHDHHGLVRFVHRIRQFACLRNFRYEPYCGFLGKSTHRLIYADWYVSILSVGYTRVACALLHGAPELTI